MNLAKPRVAILNLRKKYLFLYQFSNNSSRARTSLHIKNLEYLGLKLKYLSIAQLMTN